MDWKDAIPLLLVPVVALFLPLLLLKVFKPFAEWFTRNLKDVPLPEYSEARRKMKEKTEGLREFLSTARVFGKWRLGTIVEALTIGTSLFLLLILCPFMQILKFPGSRHAWVLLLSGVLLFVGELGMYYAGGRAARFERYRKVSKAGLLCFLAGFGYEGLEILGRQRTDSMFGNVEIQGREAVWHGLFFVLVSLFGVLFVLKRPK